MCSIVVKWNSDIRCFLSGAVQSSSFFGIFFTIHFIFIGVSTLCCPWTYWESYDVQVSFYHWYHQCFMTVFDLYISEAISTVEMPPIVMVIKTILLIFCYCIIPLSIKLSCFYCEYNQCTLWHLLVFSVVTPHLLTVFNLIISKPNYLRKFSIILHVLPDPIGITYCSWCDIQIWT